MPLKLRKILPLVKGLKLNLSKSGASITLGKKGSAINIGTKGVRASIGKVGSGIGWSEYNSYKSGNFKLVFIIVLLTVLAIWLFTK